ncbi:MAG: hypothetical protein ABR598_05770 [Candidatus Dormibacteria bacterium]
MSVLRVDEVLMPGQVASLRRRLELMSPEQERLTAELKELTEQAGPEAVGPGRSTGSDKTSRQIAKVRLQLGAVTREMESLQSLIDARLSQAERRRV